MIDFVVTGCGRSSTKGTAQMLTLAGLPCAHEHACSSWMDDYSDDQVWRDAPTGIGESSWQAAPFAGEMQAAGVKVVHLVRHPAEVASSLIGNGMMLPGLDGRAPWHEFLTTHLSEAGERLWRLHPHDRALQFWTDWNLLIEKPDLRWVVPVIGADIDDLGRLLGREVDLRAISAVSPQTNHRRDIRPLGKEDFSTPIWDGAMDVWRSYCFSDLVEM